MLGTLKFNRGKHSYHDALGAYFDKMTKKIIIYDVMEKIPCEADIPKGFH